MSNQQNDIYYEQLNELKEENNMITDKGLEKLWLELRDIPTTEDGIEIDQSFHIWPKGTDVNVVWHWFDDRHSKGMVKGLMYGDK